MQTQTNYTGIDISKLFFDVAVPNEKGYNHYKFSNDEVGFKALLSVVSADDHMVMEASGPYSSPKQFRRCIFN